MSSLLTAIMAACLAIGIGPVQTVVLCVMDGQASESCCCSADQAKKDCCCPKKEVKKSEHLQALDAAKFSVALPAAPLLAVVQAPKAEHACKNAEIDSQEWATGPPAFVRYCSYLI